MLVVLEVKVVLLQEVLHLMELQAFTEVAVLLVKLSQMLEHLGQTARQVEPIMVLTPNAY
tara:strand:- start:43 stop:222 length:180 start_codon:yes stop_codon:yes gene_type:complete